jgi:hypothetical protein
MRIKKFTRWLSEDFAAVGVAPTGNVSGMGPVVAPTADSVGSGDAWPTLGAPSSLAPLAYKKRRKKRKKKVKKLSEAEKTQLEDEINFHEKEDIDWFLGILALTADKDFTDFDWINEFDEVYNSAVAMNLDSGKPQKDFRDRFSQGKYTYANLTGNIIPSGWKTKIYDEQRRGSEFITFLERELSKEEIELFTKRIPEYIRMNKGKLRYDELVHLLKFVTEEEQERLRGFVSGVKFGL